MENILFEEYNRYFQKSPTAWTVRSRGKKVLSENIDFKFDEHFSNIYPKYFCLNDPASSVSYIRKNETNYKILDEGLIATYPTEKVLKYFKTLFKKVVNPKLVEETIPGTQTKIYDFVQLSDENEKISPLLMICVPALNSAEFSKLIKFFTDSFAKTGYYMSAYDIDKTDNFMLAYIQFEAKYTNLLVDLADILYHVSPLKNLQKILKHGLVPYSKSSQYKYDDRVYLFNKCDKAIVYNYALYKAQAAKDNGFCVFKIHKDRLINDPLFKDGKQKFYLDPSFSMYNNKTDQTAIFTRNNIPLRILDKQYIIVKFDENNIINSEEVKTI